MLRFSRIVKTTKNAKQAFRSNTFKNPQKRTFLSSLNEPAVITKNQKIFYTGMGGLALFGVLSLVAEGVYTTFSKKTIGMNPEVMERVRDTYSHVGCGLTVTALMARYLFKGGIASRLAAMNPMALLFGSLALMIGTNIATQSINYQENPLLKYTMWTAFNLSIALSMCPLGALGGAVLMKSAIATGAIFGSMSAIAAFAPSEYFLNWGTGLGIGLGAVIAASIGQIFFPSPILSAVALYGGLGLFSLFAAHDTQAVVANCKYSRYYGSD